MTTPARELAEQLAATEFAQWEALLQPLVLDAERYRIVRERPSITMEPYEAVFLSPTEIDEAADAARSES